LCFSWTKKKEDPELARKHWTDMLIVSSDGKIYIMFNFLITILCLVSSYYYGSIAGFRYTLVTSGDLDHMFMQYAFEGVFLLHFIT
jgi:hypothetical protein